MQKVIKDVKNMGEPSEFKGAMYQAVWVTFNDGSSGMANMKAGSNAYGAGDTVNVEVTGQTKTGKDRLKIKKDNGYNSGGYSSGSTPAPQRDQEGQQKPAYGGAAIGARVGCSFNAAVALCVAGKIDASELDLTTRQFVDMLAKVEKDAQNGTCSKFTPSENTNTRGSVGTQDDDDMPF